MRKTISTVMAVVLMAVLLVFAAPAPQAAATPGAPGTAQCWDFVQTACDIADATVGTVEGIAGQAYQVVDFIKDPLGYVAAAVMGAATWMLSQVAKMGNASTAPDLSSDWWKSAYAQAWAIGLVLFCFVLLWEFGQFAMRKISPEEFGATLALWGPATLAGMLFGPMIAQCLINGATYLAAGLIQHMPGFGGSDAFNSVESSVQNTAAWASGATGAVQAFLALFFGILMFIAAVVVFLSLCLQSVVLYLCSAAFPIAIAFMASTRGRSHAYSLPRMFIAICFSKVILFFTLGLCLAMATAATSIQGDGVSRDLALVVMAILGMFLAAFAPMILLRHAPVLPGTSRHVGVGLAGAGAAAVGYAAGSGIRGAGRAVKAGGSAAAGAAGSTGSKLNDMIRSKSVRHPSSRVNHNMPGRTIDAPVGGATTGSSGAVSAPAAPAAAAGAVAAPKPAAPKPSTGGGSAVAGTGKKKPPGHPGSARAAAAMGSETRAAAERAAGRDAAGGGAAARRPGAPAPGRAIDPPVTASSRTASSAGQPSADEQVMNQSRPPTGYGSFRAAPAAPNTPQTPAPAAGGFARLTSRAGGDQHRPTRPPPRPTPRPRPEPDPPRPTSAWIPSNPTPTEGSQ